MAHNLAYGHIREESGARCPTACSSQDGSICGMLSSLIEAVCRDGVGRKPTNLA
jgi:hypothetical protein